jgi:hypothetical protein
MNSPSENKQPDLKKGLWLYVVVNGFTMIGSLLMAVSFAVLLMAMGADFISPISNNYALTILFAFLPAIFLFGFALHVFGIIKYRRRKTDEVGVITQSLGNVLSDARSRKIIFFSAFAFIVSLLILSAAGHRALIYSESREFCGTLCHQVMGPEYTTYLDSPHSQVSCVECHIGEGMSSFVRAKIDGIPMIWEALHDSYPRPVPSPVHTLRPSRDTCEKCHWPSKFHGNKLSLFTHFGEDIDNTAYNTVMVQNVGGQDPKTGEYHGIHWHVSSNVQIYYEALDDKREKIGKVTYKSGDKIIREYKLADSDDSKVHETRLMECVDCHNRPSHIFGEKPAFSVDKAMVTGVIDASIPYAKKAATAVITDTNVSRDHAEATFKTRLSAYYAAEHADISISEAQLSTLAAGVAKLFLRNIFPENNVVWDTHPSHLGHRGGDNDERGCFRCHDDKHTSDDGKVISQDCDLCHNLLAEDEKLDDLAEPIKALISSHKEK